MAQRIPGLSERESAVLRAVVDAHVDTGAPVGSEWLTRRQAWGLSPATIRAVLLRLDEAGYLRQPHTSAGRVPTAMGYRAYVADRFRDDGFAADAAAAENLPGPATGPFGEGDCERLLGQLAQAIGEVTHQLGLVLAPRFAAGVLQRLELVRLSSGRLLLVVTITGGAVHSLAIASDAVATNSDLEALAAALNERLHGLTLAETRRSGRQRLAGAPGDPQLVQAVTDGIAGLSGPGETELHVAGTGHLCRQPEFQDPVLLADLVQLLESREVLASLMRDRRGVMVTVGLGDVSPAVRHCSMVTASCDLAGRVGVVGVIGPMRMPYGRVVNLVNRAASQAASWAA